MDNLAALAAAARAPPAVPPPRRDIDASFALSRRAAPPWAWARRHGEPDGAGGRGAGGGAAGRRRDDPVHRAAGATGATAGGGGGDGEGAVAVPRVPGGVRRGGGVPGALHVGRTLRRPPALRPPLPPLH